jgi:hypothetical protein
VVGVYTTGLDNVEVQVPSTTYIVSTQQNLLALNLGQVWPLHRGKAGFRVRYTTGYGDMPTTPGGLNPVQFTIRRHILALAAAMDNTRDAPTLSAAAEQALQPYRVVGELRMASGMTREDILA